MRFTGLDISGSGGSPEPALRLVREHLAVWAPEAVAFVDTACDAMRAYAAPNNAAASQRYGELDAAARDRATTALARLLLRVEAPGPGREHRVARHHALGALRLDEQLREFAVLSAPGPPAQVVSSRDVYTAESVRLVRELAVADERLVVLAHNGHLQRIPFTFLSGVSAPSAGTYLAHEFGDDYVTIGLTALAGSTPGHALDEAERHGIALHTEPLGEADSASSTATVSSPPRRPRLAGAAGSTTRRSLVSPVPRYRVSRARRSAQDVGSRPLSRVSAMVDKAAGSWPTRPRTSRPSWPASTA